MKLRTDATPKVELLQETLKIWQDKLGKDIKNLRFGPKHCPLCKVYFGRGCEGCPISDYTNSRYCGSTPYEFVLGVVVCYKDNEDKPTAHEHIQKAIKKEITFLEKLLNLYRDIEAHEHSMELARQTDNAYHVSGRHDQDTLILNNLKARAKKGQD